ncbi:MAG: phosphoribosylamine--glycine ligase [Polyangiaceae bacterium]|nr:phosphoribosylamine--glycine ligase [Polyangiaceae bacterium]
MSKLKVLVVGSGGREHALALRLLESESVAEVVGCPGNAGMASGLGVPDGKSLRVQTGQPEDVAVAEKVDLVVIGPEVPLVDGLADRFQKLNLPCFGPSAAAAQLEGSKAFMKEFCRRHGIATAREVIVRSPEALEEALAQFSSPPVVKADGLCAGKGVVVAETMEEARSAAAAMLSGDSFGSAGTTLVLEERLLGEEASVHALCDGERAIILPVAQDHKRIFEGDRGPNTGGMGTYAPAPVVDAALLETIDRDVIQKVVQGMKADGVPLVGTLFVGFMISPAGEAKVLEFNIRFGDPETQVLTMITEGDWGKALLAAAQGRLEKGDLRVSEEHAMCVVLAAENYPAAPAKGDKISGLEEVAALEGVRVFHAGTAAKENDLVTSGGRVLGVTAKGPSLAAARDLAYEACSKICFRGMQYRKDIGYRAL